MHKTELRGARTNNLKAVDLVIEPASFIAIAGPSGSGKSSLALSTLYAEGQRRYVESFSAYARQFLERRLIRPFFLTFAQNMIIMEFSIIKHIIHVYMTV